MAYDPAGNLATGTPVGADFEIGEYVASGGMGFIYRGAQRSSGRQVAIKVMRDQLRGDSSAVKRFRREAETVRQLEHPNTIELLDYGSMPTGQLYIVMEWLEGCDLAEYLEGFGVLDAPRAAFITSCVARACAEAHHKGIIHRDLKPENIFLVRTADGSDQIKVLDFGIAKIVGGPPATQITRIGMVCGTPDFMSPEQGRGEDLDGRSDVYALGCLLYTLLVGDTPFPADTPLKIVMRHQLEAFPDLPPHLPVVLNGIVRRATEKDRNKRFADADEMANVLDTFVATASAHLYANRGTGILPSWLPPPEPVTPRGDDTHLPNHHSRIATEMLEMDLGGGAATAQADLDDDDPLANRPTELHHFDLGGQARSRSAPLPMGGAGPATPAPAPAAHQRQAIPQRANASTLFMPQLQGGRAAAPDARAGGSNARLVLLAVLVLAVVGVAIVAVVVLG